MLVNGETAFTGIIGRPVRHSLSPVFQNAAFEAVGLNWVYLAFDVVPDELRKSIAGLKAGGCRGLNITMPYKREILPLLDELDETALRVDAVNTVEFRAGRLIGHNTDGAGFIKSLRQDAGFDPRGADVLIIGAGGAARSISVALGQAGARSLIVLNRDVGKAERLVMLIDSYFPDCLVEAAGSGHADPAGFDLLVNATSVGMENNPGLPLATEGLTSAQVVYDIIYWPLETQFLKAAAEKGARTINGLRMLLFQGAESFSIWTGLEAPIGRMAAALEERRPTKE